MYEHNINICKILCKYIITEYIKHLAKHIGMENQDVRKLSVMFKNWSLSNHQRIKNIITLNLVILICIFISVLSFSFCFFVFKTKFHYVALTVLELTTQTRLYSSSLCLCLLNVRTKGMSHYAQLLSYFFMKVFLVTD